MLLIFRCVLPRVVNIARSKPVQELRLQVRTLVGTWTFLHAFRSYLTMDGLFLHPRNSIGYNHKGVAPSRTAVPKKQKQIPSKTSKLNICSRLLNPPDTITQNPRCEKALN